MWEQVSGPKTATIGNGSTNKAAITALDVAGSYVFKLTVKDDKGVSASDQVTVTVKAAAEPPVANAGNDITNAKILALLGDSITTDHISPAGDIEKAGPRGEKGERCRRPVVRRCRRFPGDRTAFDIIARISYSFGYDLC